MAQLTLGIAMDDDLLSAVVVEGKARDLRVRACGTVVPDRHADFSEKLPELLEQVGWQGGRCVVGLPLSLFSLRNLSLPFTNEKKIEQVLPLELEEHLLVPVADQVCATMVTAADDDQSRLLVASLEKKTLAQYLSIFQAHNLDPHIVSPAAFALAERVAKDGRNGGEFLLLYGTYGSMTMVLVHRARVVFMRRLVYPEQVFTHDLISFAADGITIAEMSAADEVFGSVCGSVLHSLEYFSATSMLNLKPDHVLLSGPMAGVTGLRQGVEDALGLPTTVCRLLQDDCCSKFAADCRQPVIYDCPLALALLGASRQAACNFRKDEFAPLSPLVASRKQLTLVALAAALLVALLFGYLYVDYQALNREYERLAASMEQVFKKSFPGVTRLVDPVAQLQARLAEVETSKVSMPLFTEEKRVLEILADISARIPADISLHVSRLVIDQDSVKIKGTTDAFNNVNRIKKLLVASPRYAAVNIVSATKAKDRDGIRFEIKLQLGENG